MYFFMQYSNYSTLIFEYNETLVYSLPFFRFAKFMKNIYQGTYLSPVIELATSLIIVLHRVAFQSVSLRCYCTQWLVYVASY